MTSVEIIQRARPTTTTELAARVESILASLPFYSDTLGPSLRSFLRHCTDPSRALRNAYIRRLYLGGQGLNRRENRLSKLSARISHPERCFPVLRRNPRNDEVFTRALGDGFVTLDAVCHALQRLGARRVEVLPPNAPRGGGPDARATARPPFLIEAKRIRGEFGYFRLRDELESALIVAGLDPFLSVDVRPDRDAPRGPAGWVAGVLEGLSEVDLRAIAGQVVACAATSTPRFFRFRELVIRVDPSRQTGLDVMYGAGVVEPIGVEGIERKVFEVAANAVNQLAAGQGGSTPAPNDFIYLALELPGRAVFFPEENRRALENLRRRVARKSRVRVRLQS